MCVDVDVDVCSLCGGGCKCCIGNPPAAPPPAIHSGTIISTDIHVLDTKPYVEYNFQQRKPRFMFDGLNVVAKKKSDI